MEDDEADVVAAAKMSEVCVGMYGAQVWLEVEVTGSVANDVESVLVRDSVGSMSDAVDDNVGATTALELDDVPSVYVPLPLEVPEACVALGLGVLVMD